ncbi:MAG: HesB/IscA family protein [Thermoplasmatota archaeon]
MAETVQTTTPEGRITFQTELSMSVSDLARQKLQDFLGDRSLDQVGVRIGVQPGGCSGASYGMEFAESKEPGELTLMANGVKLYIAPEHAALLNGVQIDFVDELMGGGFKIHNPNAKSSCGCGKSFSA